MRFPWKVREVDATRVGRLAERLDVHPVTARCLTARGIDGADEARAYLSPKLAGLRRPAGLAGLEGAVDRLARAVTGGERIGCFGDYDVDGVTTTALLTSLLEAMGAACVPRVARRTAGYGFGVDDAAFFADRGCSLIVTGDCGTSDLDAIRAARARGIDVVVVDHHTVPSRDEAHPALALVNPFRADSTFPFRGMASVGLAFYLMAALRTRLAGADWFRGRAAPDMRDFLDLVALGTVADLVPLQGENRILTAKGLELLGRRARPGIAALLHVAGVDGDRAIDERTIAWKIAPRLNAPGRLGDAEPALRLLLADERTAMEHAERLEGANDERRTAQDRVLEEALAAVGEGDPGPAVVVAGRGWPPGVVGIVAAKLVDEYRRPAFVIAIDEHTGEGRGSARTWPGVNLYDTLHRCRGALIRYGGHAAAAGLTVREERIAELREALWHAVECTGGGADADARCAADAEVDLAALDHRLADELGTLAPFGKGNDEPTLITRGLRVASTRRVGDGSHLKMQLEPAAGGDPVPAIAFGMGEDDPGEGASLDVAYTPTINEWRGRRTVEMTVRDFTRSD